MLSFSLCLAACHKLPDAVDSQGQPVYLTDYKGKWVVVNYWAAWCKPCLAELPDLSALAKQYADKVTVLGVSFDTLSNAEIQKFADSLHLNFPLLANFPIEKFAVSEIPSLPMTLLISPQGTLVQTLYGPQTKESLLKSMQLQ
jgi:peroxiredoxin